MILLDISTMYEFRHWRPMGILRVEREVHAAFTANAGDDLCCAIFDQKHQGFYKLPAQVLDDLLAGCDPQSDPVPRVENAPTKWRSFMRLGRCLFQARRRSRLVDSPEPLAHHQREAIIAEELLRLSLKEFSILVKMLRRITWLAPRLRDRIMQFEDINHRAHHGLMNTAQDLICTPANRIKPEEVDCYVSAGSFWADDRFRHAYEMKRVHGWSLHYCIYDLVPIYWGHLAEPMTRQTFPHALHWLLWGVDHIWTISETSKRDILAHVEKCGYPVIEADQIKPVYLGSSIENSGLSAQQEKAFFAEHNLEPGKFVLMVGTLEPRKNHDFAYRLWRALAERDPDNIMPLVWAGQPGWHVEPLLEMLRNDYGLAPGTIRVLTHVPDAELASLYKACRFTIFPSHFEGWGLPVVESLNYGKPCLTSTTPALLEAGGGCSEPIDLFDGLRWLDHCQALMSDEHAYALACEKAAGFEGFSWAGFRTNIYQEFTTWRAADAARDLQEHR